jgi:hypothetical protein
MNQYHVKLDVKRSICYRSGEEAARGAHNSEDTGSKPVSGKTIHPIAMVHKGTGALFYPLWRSGSARGDGAKPITRGRGIETHRRTCQAGRKT